MNHCDCRPPHGGRFPSRPVPPVPPDPPPAPCIPGGGFLMQRILACGRVCRRRQCCHLCLSALPDCAVPPLTVLDVSVSGAPQQEEAPCRRRCAYELCVVIPLCVRLRDARGQTFSVPSRLEEELTLRPSCPESECWRGQVFVQAAVRLAGRACLPCRDGAEIPLEVLIEGYLLASCRLGGCEAGCRPDPRPWYPQPLYDPFNYR